MRSTLLSVTFLLLASFAGGCDSSGPPTATEELEGTWTLYIMGDLRGNITNIFTNETESATFDFQSGGKFNITVDYNAVGEAAGYADRVLSGTYSRSRNLRQLTLNFSSGTSIVASGDFSGPTKFLFSIPAVEFNPIFGGTTKLGVVEIGIERV